MSFTVNLTNELTRMFKKKKTIVFLIINLVICMGAVASSLILSLSTKVQISNIWAGLHTVFFYGVLPMYIFIETLEIFTQEMSTGLIRNILIRPITRIKVYSSKIMAIGIFILFQIITIIIFCTLISLISRYNINTIATGIMSYLISFIPLLAFVFVAALIAQLVKNGLLGMLFCLFFTFVCYATELFFVYASAFIFTRHLKMYRMVLTDNINGTGIISALLIIGAVILCSFASGFLLFSKKEY